MATITAGTSSSTALTAVVAAPANVLAPADLATVAQAILDDQNVAHPTWPGAYSFDGLLFVPNRGVLRVLRGDVFAVDPHSGWPVLLAPYAFSATSAVWSHS